MALISSGILWAVVNGLSLLFVSFTRQAVIYIIVLGVLGSSIESWIRSPNTIKPRLGRQMIKTRELDVGRIMAGTRSQLIKEMKT